MKPQRAVRCSDCDQDIRALREYHYKIVSELWLKIARSDEHLCIACLEKRLGRTLVPSDFSKSEINRKKFNKSSTILNRMSEEMYKLKLDT